MQFLPVAGRAGAVSPWLSPMQAAPNHIVPPPSPIRYGGPCLTCGGSHFLSTSPEALEHANRVAGLIQVNQTLDYSSSVPDPCFHEDWLLTKGPGRMLGVLVAVDSQGAIHALKAFSGQITESWHITGWAGPLASLTNATPVYQEVRRVTEELSAKISQLKALLASQSSAQASSSGSSSSSSRRFLREQVHLLKQRRKGLSHHLLQQIQQSYQTADCSGQPVSLLHTYLQYHNELDPSSSITRAGSFRGFPSGTGDCCGPKLLHAAAQQGLTPVGMVEVWYGSAPGTATKAKAGRAIPPGGLSADSSRQHLHCYGMCDKCRAILGTMLCGIEAAQERAGVGTGG